MTTLSRDTIEWAINHFTHHPDTDIFPKPFEFEAIEFCRSSVIDWLSRQDICQWTTRPFRRCLVPKQRYGFRVATQLDPLDSLFYLCLILETGSEIEYARLPISRNASFSSRFDPNDLDFNLFNKNIRFNEFQTRNKDLAQHYRYVVFADIADFYPRIYLHRLEGALDSALHAKKTHATAIKQLIKGWNQNVSYGIPVGCEPSRLLAELVIDHVDRTLLDDGFAFTRFVDDYRIFCNSREEAYRRLASLANTLYATHGLTLQSQKTKIITSEEFIASLSRTENQIELDALHESFDEILQLLDMDDPYRVLDYDFLDPEVQMKIDKLNLEQLLENQLNAEEIDTPMLKFLINRFGQLQNTTVLSRLLTETEKLYPVFPEVIEYLSALGSQLSSNTSEKIGEFLLGKLQNSVVSHLEYHRTIIMSLFADSAKWGNADQFASLYRSITDQWFRPAVLLAIGKAGQSYWIRSKKNDAENMPPWEKRAFLYAASCFHDDERKMYYKAMNPKLDNLEKYVVEWAKTNTIRIP